MPDRSTWPELGTGRDPADVLEDLERLRGDDVDWRGGRAFSLAYFAGDEAQRLAEAAYVAFSGENALNMDAFPSLRRMHNDVVATVCGWLHGPQSAAGFMTSGGTESLMMSVWAALGRHRRLGRRASGLNVVLPTSAHAALEKACAYFSVESRRVPVGDDWRADPTTIAGAIDEGTILIVASAPQYPQGVIDPVADIASVAEARDVNLHVDACMGGVVLPYLERAGYRLPEWDFRLPGVTSISVDLHKYGYAMKGAGVIIHRDRERRSDQTFVTDNWLGGFYGSSGVLGTKSGGAIAAAWAVMRHLGDDGYRRLAEDARNSAEQVADFVVDHPDLALRARPDSTLVSFGVAPDSAAASRGWDVGRLASALRGQGWYLDVQSPPPSLHMTLNAVHRGTLQAFLEETATLLEGTPPDAGGPGEFHYGSVG